MSVAESLQQAQANAGAIPTISTDRLLLRRPRMDDAPRIVELLDNFNVAGNLARVRLPYTIADTRSWLPLKTVSTDPAETAFMITTAQDGVIGTVGFHLDRGQAVLGYWLGEPFWGQGYMTEAVTAAVGWFFAASGADQIRSGVFHFNMASLAIQHKLGFVEIGRSMVPCLARGKEIEHIDTELARDDFESLGD